MKNIQIIDRADNATFSIFQATDAEFEAIFPGGRDMEIAEHFVKRVGQAQAGAILGPIWERPILKRDALGIHGTIYYGWLERRKYIPKSKREVDIVVIDPWGINEAQRRLFAENR